MKVALIVSPYLRMKKRHQYDVFISFAEPDRPLAILLNELLAALDFECFFAPKLVVKAPEDWQKFILQAGLKRASCFVPIYTQNSLKRPWVLFEAGAAAATKLRFIATRVEAVNTDEIMKLPFGHHLNIFGLHKVDDIKNLARNVYRQRLATAESRNIEEHVSTFNFKLDDVFKKKSDLVEKLRCEATYRRWVFIAGNLPHESGRQGELRAFVHAFTEKLIDNGFSICACPMVKDVGKVALEVAHSRIDESIACAKDSHGCELKYEFGGIYPIDHELRHSEIGTPEVRANWRQHLLEFREKYLENQEWVILIGGNSGTEEEFEAIQRINRRRTPGIKTCFITDFGGSAQKLYQQVKADGDLALCIDGGEGVKSGATLGDRVATIAKRMSGR